jgi:hypothetical protein
MSGDLSGVKIISARDLGKLQFATIGAPAGGFIGAGR